jgi:methanogenic corrinoid protein MtbC1
VASRRTKLSRELLRIWERRYGVVDPRRTDSGRRQYSEEEVRKLQLLQQAVSLGHRIGGLSKLRIEDLRELIQKEADVVAASGNGKTSDRQLLENCVTAVRDLDAPRLQSLLNRALVSLDGTAYVDELLVPLFNRIGTEWERGTMEPYHEHLATSTVRNILARFLAQIPEDLDRRVLVATPSGHHHEIGALLVGVSAVLAGFRVLYFGTNLPAADIVSAVEKTEASILALSVIYPPKDSRTLGELEAVARDLPEGVRFVVGGRSVSYYSKALERLGVLIISDLAEFRGILQASTLSQPPFGGV